MKWSQGFNIIERLLCAYALKHMAFDKLALSVSSAEHVTMA